MTTITTTAWTTRLLHSYYALPEDDGTVFTDIPRAVAYRALRWITAGRLRRRLIGTTLILQALLITAGYVAPQASADAGVAALSWTGVHDSAGVPISSYMFSTNHGGLFNWGDSGTSFILQLEMAGILILVTLAIWFIGYAISFQWLDLIATPLAAASSSVTAQFVAAGLAAVGATIAAVAIAYNIQRGNTSRAAAQFGAGFVLVMLGATIFANPVKDAVGSDGFLSTGRNLGLSIATGMLGQTASTDPTTAVTDLQTRLADNFARKPLQLWNFGEVIDDTAPQCSNAWSQAQKSGDEDSVKDAIADCGASSSAAMKSRADNPSTGQLATGAILLLCSGVLLIFAVILGGLVIYTGVRALGYAFIAGIAFLISAIPGAVQTMVFKCVADALLSAFGMGAYVVALAVYVLIFIRTFSTPGVNPAAVQIIALIILVAGVSLLWHFRTRLANATNNLAAKMNQAAQGNGNIPRASNRLMPFGPGHAMHHLNNTAQLASNVFSARSMRNLDDSTRARQNAAAGTPQPRTGLTHPIGSAASATSHLAGATSKIAALAGFPEASVALNAVRNTSRRIATGEASSAAGTAVMDRAKALGGTAVAHTGRKLGGSPPAFAPPPPKPKPKNAMTATGTWIPAVIEPKTPGQGHPGDSRYPANPATQAGDATRPRHALTSTGTDTPAGPSTAPVTSQATPTPPTVAQSTTPPALAANATGDIPANATTDIAATPASSSSQPTPGGQTPPSPRRAANTPFQRPDPREDTLQRQGPGPRESAPPATGAPTSAPPTAGN